MRALKVAVVLFGAVVFPLQEARAATEVARYPANNTFVEAVSTDPATGITTGVFVSREIGQPGGPIDTVSVIVSQGENLLFFGIGVLPTGAFQVDAKSASLNVDLHAVTLSSQTGDIPTNGLISLSWTAIDVQRDAGGSRVTSGPITFIFTGTRTQATASVTGSVFGTALVDPLASLSVVRQAVIVMTRE
jgi:hypothetical protein